jgi:hypothetical protein
VDEAEDRQAPLEPARKAALRRVSRMSGHECRLGGWDGDGAAISRS